ncbi:MAG: glycogen/starch/alpha-glucan phosphorylase [Prosthecobacter sp.]
MTDTPANPSVQDMAESFKLSITNHLRVTLGAYVETASENDWFVATSLAVRDRVMDRATKSRTKHREKGVRRVHYLSLEYLMGRLLENNLRNSGNYDAAKLALAELGKDLDVLVQKEPDMGLGNGGLGRLAACFMDSLSTLDLPAIGYGIHYEFGLFRQEFVKGKQVEHPDAWMRDGSPWKIARPGYRQAVQLYGHVVQKFDEFWPAPPRMDRHQVSPRVAGHSYRRIRQQQRERIRLWEAQLMKTSNFQIFNEGSYVDALREKALAETVSKVLYPNDATESERNFVSFNSISFVACSLADIVRCSFKGGYNLPLWSEFPSKAAIQLNDTPSCRRHSLNSCAFWWMPKSASNGLRLGTSARRPLLHQSHRRRRRSKPEHRSI